MSSFLEIQFPQDFDEKYLAYKASILKQYTLEQSHFPNTDKRAAQLKAIKSSLEKGLEQEKLNKTIDAKIDQRLNEKVVQKNNRPYCIIEGKWGFLKFSKYGNKIKIGSPDSRPFRLLQCLLEPMGTAKTTEAVYESIKLLKDKKDSDLSGFDVYKKKGKQVSIIQNAIKELQKDNKLQGKLKFEFDDTKSKIWIKYID